MQIRATVDTGSISAAALSDLAPLPETRSEILEIGAVLHADEKRDIFLGEEATEARVKKTSSDGRLSSYGIIAFATHALLPGDLDGLNQPAIALSAPLQENETDGLLDVTDITNLDLNADWVVLSACNTAEGNEKGREALSGLGRAFFYAGAKALLVSNWPVETKSTKILTTTLFRHQEENPGLKRAQALQQAKIQLLDAGELQDLSGRTMFSYAHPLLWAPFTLVGGGY